MGKIAIISVLTNDTINYGNRLQAYSLNRFVTNTFNERTDSLILNFRYRKVLNYSFFAILRKLFLKLFLKNGRNPESGFFEVRLNYCRGFTKKIETKFIARLCEIKKCDYTSIIVGSDVIWAQVDGVVDKLRFLDFKLKGPFKKIAYAPSFGKNWIPECNKKYIKNCLDDFEAISVREKSSIELLKSIGVENVAHVCDPTLLLTAEEWSSVAEPVEEVTEKYIFVYLLGKDAEQRTAITELAKKHGLKIATIPHADNIYNLVDNDFGDYRLMDASPENWVWLIKNAEYVITDSFHGSVFSTIFSKKFIVTKRHYEQDINMRMTDFLDTIDEQNKFIDITKVNSLDEFVWDYEKIHKTTDEFIAKSKEYLKNALTE